MGAMSAPLGSRDAASFRSEDLEALARERQQLEEAAMQDFARKMQEIQAQYAARQAGLLAAAVRQRGGETGAAGSVGMATAEGCGFGGVERVSAGLAAEAVPRAEGRLQPALERASSSGEDMEDESMSGSMPHSPDQGDEGLQAQPLTFAEPRANRRKQQPTERQMRELERAQDAEPPASSPSDEEGAAGDAASPGEEGETEEVELVVDERGQFPRGSWTMFGISSRKPRKITRRLLESLFEGRGLGNLYLAAQEAAPAPEPRQEGREAPTVRFFSNLKDHWDDVASLESAETPAMDIWELRLEQADMRKETAYLFMKLLKNRRNMRRHLKFRLQEVDNSDSESSTTESGGNAFEMRQWGANEGVEGPAPDSDEEALPLWEQDPADFEELSEDADGNVVRRKEASPSGKLGHIEKIEKAHAEFPTLEASQAAVRASWQVVANLAGLGPEAVAELTAGTMQKAHSLVAGQHFRSQGAAMQMAAAVADKLEAMAAYLEASKEKWQMRVLPKLEQQAPKRWRQGKSQLEAWQADASHLRVRLQRDMEGVLFTATTLNSLVLESAASLRRRCGTLEITLHDILSFGHRIQVAGLPCCPQPPQDIRPTKKRRLMKSTEAGGDGMGGEGYDSDDSFIASSDEDMRDVADPTSPADSGADSPADKPASPQADSRPSGSSSQLSRPELEASAAEAAQSGEGGSRSASEAEEEGAGDAHSREDGSKVASASMAEESGEDDPDEALPGSECVRRLLEYPDDNDEAADKPEEEEKKSAEPDEKSAEAEKKSGEPDEWHQRFSPEDFDLGDGRVQVEVREAAGKGQGAKGDGEVLDETPVPARKCGRRLSQYYTETQAKDEGGQPILALDSDDDDDDDAAPPERENGPEADAGYPAPAEAQAPSKEASGPADGSAEGLGGSSGEYSGSTGGSGDSGDDPGKEAARTPRREGSATSEEPIISPMEGPMRGTPAKLSPLFSDESEGQAAEATERADESAGTGAGPSEEASEVVIRRKRSKKRRRRVVEDSEDSEAEEDEKEEEDIEMNVEDEEAEVGSQQEAGAGRSKGARPAKKKAKSASEKDAAKRDAARRAAETRKQKQLEETNARMEKITEQNRLREEQRQQEEAEETAEEDDQFPLEPGFVRLMPRKSKWQIDEALFNTLKPHQVDGVRFMWRTVVMGFLSKAGDGESSSDEEEEEEEDDERGGCILAHSMGLGKTLQTIALLHTYHHHFPRERSLLILPKNVVGNWKNELERWLGVPEPDNLKFSKVHIVEGQADSVKVCHWSKTDSGVLLITYGMFSKLTSLTKAEGALLKAQAELNDLEREREALLAAFEAVNGDASQPHDHTQSPRMAASILLAGQRLATAEGKCKAKQQEVTAKEKALQNREVVQTCLRNSADLVVADEGHQIRNPTSKYAKALMQLRTRKRIALTGYPLQNKLMEYYTMVNWIQKDLLEEKVDFTKTYIDPITQGQKADATSVQRAQMRKALFLLQETVASCVHRLGPEILEKELPKRIEFAIFVRLPPDQEAMYEAFIQACENRGKELFQDKELLNKLCNEPDLYYKTMVECSQGQTKSLQAIVEEIPEVPEIPEIPSPSKVQKKVAGQMNPAKAKEALEGIPPFSQTEITAKLAFVSKVTKLVMRQQERLVIFSSSIPLLENVEALLKKEYGWRRDVGYSMLTGKDTGKRRQASIDGFCKPNGPRVFLLSTLAGSVGINLVTANRMIVMDGHFNPVHNAQAVARIFRYGQVKQTYIYRLLWDRTIEFRIYRRNLDKEGLSRQVVDRHNIKGVNSGDDTVLYHYEKPQVDPLEKSEAVARLAEDVVLGATLREDHTLAQPTITHVENHQDNLHDDPNLKLSKKEERRALKEAMKLRRQTVGAMDPTQGNKQRRSDKVLAKAAKKKKNMQRIDSDTSSDEDAPPQSLPAGAPAPPPAAAPAPTQQIGSKGLSPAEWAAMQEYIRQQGGARHAWAQ